MESNWKSRMVVVFGAGAVGSTFTSALAQKGLTEEIDLIDANQDFAQGQALDLAHGLPYYPSVQFGWDKNRILQTLKLLPSRRAPGKGLAKRVWHW